MRFANYKITSKVLLVSLLPMLFLGAFLAYQWYASSSRLLISQTRQHDSALADALARHMRVETSDGSDVRDAASTAIAAHATKIPHLLFAEITTPAAKVMASTPPQKEGAVSFDREEILRVAKNREQMQKFVMLTGANVRKSEVISAPSPLILKRTAHEFTRPIIDRQGRLIAVAHVYFAADDIPRQLRGIVVFASGTVALVLILYTALLFWAGRRYIEKPLQDLTDTAEAIADGNLYIRAPAIGKDEIARLGKAFNNMTDALLHLEVRADTDALTGLYNFRHFQRFLQRQVELGAQMGRPFSLAILDVDHFKDVNDTYGHPEGDRVLSNIGDYLRRMVRAADYVARYGGEEFVIVLPDIGVGDAFEICDRLRERMPKEVMVSDGGSRPIEISVGLADYPAVAETGEKLLQAADSALLFAKKNGRNQVVHFQSLPTRPITVAPDLELVIERLRQSQMRNIGDLVDHIEMTEYSRPGHGEKVAHTATVLARAAGVDGDKLEAIYSAARVHDVGKVSIPAALLVKEEPLSEAEREMIRSHPQVGEEILGAVSEVAELVPAVLYHHERWDGTGYPRGLAGEKIPLSARIMAIAEAYETMTSEHPYQGALGVEQALVELRRNAGSQFDPKLIEVFIGQKAKEASASA